MGSGGPSFQKANRKKSKKKKSATSVVALVVRLYPTVCQKLHLILPDAFLLRGGVPYFTLLSSLRTKTGFLRPMHDLMGYIGVLALKTRRKYKSGFNDIGWLLRLRSRKGSLSFFFLFPPKISLSNQGQPMDEGDTISRKYIGTGARGRVVVSQRCRHRSNFIGFHTLKKGCPMRGEFCSFLRRPPSIAAELISLASLA